MTRRLPPRDGRLSDEGLLNVALFERSNGCVDLCLVCPEEMGTQLRGVGAGQGPGLSALGESGAEASPDLRLIFGANLKPSFLELGAEPFDIGLYPERHERLSIGDRPAVLAVQQEPSERQVVHALRNRAESHIRLFGQGAVGGVDQVGPDQDGHYGLDPALLWPSGTRCRLLGWLPTLNMNEQTGRVEVNVAGEIQIVDLRPLKSRRLLCANVRCKEEQAVLSVLGWQVRSTSVQLVDDDGDVLVSEVSFLFDQVSNGPAGCPPGDNAVEAAQGLGGQADLGLRHPLLESRLVCIQICRRCWPDHVRYTSMFINNEQDEYMNSARSNSAPPA